MATELTLYFWGVVCLLQKYLAKYLQGELHKHTFSASTSFQYTSLESKCFDSSKGLAHVITLLHEHYHRRVKKRR